MVSHLLHNIQSNIRVLFCVAGLLVAGSTALAQESQSERGAESESAQANKTAEVESAENVNENAEFQDAAERKDVQSEQSPVSAFGFTLGEALSKKATIKVTNIKHQVDAVIPYKIFENYFVEITPNEREIYLVEARGELPSLRDAKDEFEILRNLLLDKYGSAQEKRTQNDVRYIEFKHQNGVIRLTRNNNRLLITYIHYDLMAKANAQYQALRDQKTAQKRERIAKDAFRDPDAI